MQFLTNPNYDFLGKTKILMMVSLALILGGAAYIAKNGIRYGVEFSGGTEIILKFQSAPATDRVRAAVDRVVQGASIQTYDVSSKNQVLVRLPDAPGPAAGTPAAPAAPAAGTPGGVSPDSNDLSGPAKSVRDAITAGYPENPILESSTEIVGPVVGQELRQKAVELTLFGLAFQLLYIAFRFKGAVWGVAATLAVFHDVIITIGLLMILKYEITLNVIAALLTLVGYSVNDTIVVFDRVRENLRQRRKEPLAKVINDSINQTLSRTIISSGTTFLTVLGLYLFGGEVLRGFGFTMVIGIIVGTYSSIYIAAPIVVWWQGMAGRRNGGQRQAATAAL